ncbi:DUF4307 domain-containing protein [Hoyosella sp. YIM 151337]|uniref:DUF4307 domain-containing protein n=1 Tax=Hoyosella sp. YIM 151337 TaxID=2992742 RepID=UPI002235E0B3|nr:DUF4307 domain-containing protein [Hoyosella sp. YIM 151337]MCW4355036.1 DUF4307 domain-containing protein [Hoyosella sp. YIM 151337]
MTTSRHMPSGRYPSARTGRRVPRWAVVALGAVFVTVLGVVVYLGYRPLTTSPITAERLAYDILDESTLEIRFKVLRDDPSEEVVCVVRARSRDGSETGRREIYVPPSASAAVEVTTTIKTSQPPGMGDVYGCSADVPDYLTRTEPS